MVIEYSALGQRLKKDEKAFEERHPARQSRKPIATAGRDPESRHCYGAASFQSTRPSCTAPRMRGGPSEAAPLAVCPQPSAQPGAGASLREAGGWGVPADGLWVGRCDGVVSLGRCLSSCFCRVVLACATRPLWQTRAHRAPRHPAAPWCLHCTHRGPAWSLPQAPVPLGPLSRAPRPFLQAREGPPRACSLLSS